MGLNVNSINPELKKKNLSSMVVNFLSYISAANVCVCVLGVCDRKSFTL